MMAAHPQLTPQHHHLPQTLEDNRILLIGDLQMWVDEAYLHSCFAHTGEVLSIKVIHNKITGHPEGYGFIEFMSHTAAQRVLQAYNGTSMPGTEQPFRLNWASFGIGERRPNAGAEHSIFVGDLAPEVSDYLLQGTFRAHYPSVRGAKVVTDPSTGRSKGYGFVKFADEMERNRAMTEMNGQYRLSRPMRISATTPNKTPEVQEPYAVAKALYPIPAYIVPPLQPVQPAQSLVMENDPNNTTIYIGNLDPNVTEEELRQNCSQFGDIGYVKIPASKGCGFVQFAVRASADEAIQKLQGVVIGQQAVRVSWGKSPTAKHDGSGWGQQVDASQWGVYYGYGQGYDAYAYGAVQDPSAYAYGQYAGYAQYPQQDGAYSPDSMNYYKYGYSEPVPTQYYSNSPSYEIFDHLVGINEYSRRESEFPSTLTTEETRATNQQSDLGSNTRNRNCPRSHHTTQEFQTIWQDNIDPDHMSYEELLELGETVGTHSRGLSHEQISLLPVSKFHCCFLRRKSRSERCVICQMEYKRGARLITLPCKHKYHLTCATKWLSINKACPICYTDVAISGVKKSDE